MHMKETYPSLELFLVGADDSSQLLDEQGKKLYRGIMQMPKVRALYQSMIRTLVGYTFVIALISSHILLTCIHWYQLPWYQVADDVMWGLIGLAVMLILWLLRIFSTILDMLVMADIMYTLQKKSTHLRNER